MFQKVVLHYNWFYFHGVALRAPRCESFHAARETIKNSQLNVKVSQIENNFHKVCNHSSIDVAVKCANTYLEIISSQFKTLDRQYVIH